MPPATIRRVAELAGVSTATVSRALAHPEKVSEQTREKVLEAVRVTGFVPNRQAVDFRRQTTGNVVLLVRDIANPFYLDIYRGVETQAFANGYGVLMGDAGYDDARVCRYVDMVRNRQADGLILMTGWIPQTIIHSRLPPIVVSLEIVNGVSLPTIAIDNHAAARMAVEHLLSLGHRRIAHFTGPMTSIMSADRHTGYLAALADAGISVDPRLVIHANYHLESGREATARLIEDGVDFTAIFASSDEMAVGAVNELRARGRRVPNDISVVGFDDTFFADACDPPLTTIRQPRRDIGARSMDMMIALLSGAPIDPPNELATVELVVRGSTARAK